MACQAEMGEMVSKETLDLQVLAGGPLPQLRDSDLFSGFQCVWGSGGGLRVSWMVRHGGSFPGPLEQLWRVSPQGAHLLIDDSA